MKKLSFLPILALTLAIGAAFAFSPGPQRTTAGEKWFEFTGGDINDPLNYELYNGDGESTPSCTIGSTRCAVLVQPDASDPDHPDETSLQSVSGSNIKNRD